MANLKCAQEAEQNIQMVLETKMQQLDNFIMPSFQESEQDINVAKALVCFVQARHYAMKDED